MRTTGTLKTWHDDRGFGFIAPADGGRDVFVHISALALGGSRPVVGETLFYDLVIDPQGRPRAVGVSRTWEPPAPAPSGRSPRAPSASTRDSAPTRRRPPARRRGRSPGLALGVMAILGLGAYGYDRYANPTSTTIPGTSTPRPLASAPPSVPAFRCDGRTRCPEMRSCEEATFFMRNCPGVVMDSDGDGVPCEDQWCGR